MTNFYLFVVFSMITLSTCTTEASPNLDTFSSLKAASLNISQSCKDAVERLSMYSITRPDLIAQYWDSWGKPDHEILLGHTTHLGNFDECMGLKETPLGEMDYCVYSFAMNRTVRSSSTLHYLLIGVCFPVACTSVDFAKTLSGININSLATVTGDPFSNSTATVVSTQFTSANSQNAFSCPTNDMDYDVATVFVFILVGLLIGMVLVGTILDVLLKRFPPRKTQAQQPPAMANGSACNGRVANKTDEKHDEKQPLLAPASNRTNKYDTSVLKDIILSFSLYKNAPILFSTKQAPSAIKALGGIRIFCMLWIMMSHIEYLDTFFFYEVTQNNYWHDIRKRFTYQPIDNTTFAVDSFLVLSALLSSYLTMKDMERKGKFRFVYFYVHRILRISPLYFVVLLFAFKIFPHVVTGPIWNYTEYHGCQHYWWTNFLYANNFLHWPDQWCIGVTWYLAVDMQLYVISPIFIVLLYKAWYIGLAVIAATMVGAMVTIGVLTGENKFYAVLYANPDPIKQDWLLYDKPYFRINQYLIGIILGYIFYKKFWIHKLSCIGRWTKLAIFIAMWMVAGFLCLSVSYGTYKEWHHHHFSDFENIVFLMFAGTAWGVGVSLIIYACNSGYGGIANTILSWSVWEPLVKMTFGAYLIHVLLINLALGSLKNGLIYTDYVTAMIHVFIAVVAYSISVIASLVVEIPLSHIVNIGLKLTGLQSRSK